MARFHKWKRETNHNLPNRISWKHAHRGVQTAQKQRPYVVLQQTSISWTEKVCDSMWEEFQIKDKAPLYAQMFFIISVKWLHCCNALCFVDNFSFFTYASWFFYKLIRRKMFQMKNYHKKQTSKIRAIPVDHNLGPNPRGVLIHFLEGSRLYILCTQLYYICFIRVLDGVVGL